MHLSSKDGRFNLHLKGVIYWSTHGFTLTVLAIVFGIIAIAITVAL
ncbi:MAG: hypothetical protein OEY59_06420 [Deltaproteobacteria bacterium]|nr:hypothetical protein [Deltaproteobacteria bacterium]